MIIMISKTKKAFLVLFWLCLYLWVFSFAQQDNETVISWMDVWSKTLEVDMATEETQKSINDINQIKAFFCNWDDITDSIFLSVVPGEEKDLCVRFENNNDEQVFFISDFFETSMTASGYPVCNSGNPINLFTKSISNDWWNTTKVPAKSYVQKDIKLKFPIWYSWLYHFCHYYKVDSSKSTIPMFNIVVHKQSFMDIFVNTSNVNLSGAVEASNLQRSGETLSFSMKNNFPFDQEVSFYATISNIFWFKKEITLENDIIRYNTSKSFNINITDLPYYKWPFNLNMKIKYKPHFDFDVKNSGMDQKILDWWEVDQKLSFFIFDKVQLIMLAVLFILIFLIKMAFFSKPRVVYVNQENNQKDLNKTL